MEGKGLRSLAPVLKWMGGKRQLFPQMDPFFPDLSGKRYFEPFLGGASVLFHLRPEDAVVNDKNLELINLYRVIQSDPEPLISELLSYGTDKDSYYRIRSLDTDRDAYSSLSPIQRAARLVYLNKTCFNGVYRINRNGEFNVPYGWREKNLSPVADRIRKVSEYFRSARIVFLSTDFEDAVLEAKEGDFVYFDPPYDVADKSKSFDGYTADGFSGNDLIRLRDLAVRLIAKGVKVMISDSDTGLVRNLFSGDMFSIHEIQAKRVINCRAEGRGAVPELLILGND